VPHGNKGIGQKVLSQDVGVSAARFLSLAIAEASSS
jgi:hypothetical protein